MGYESKVRPHNIPEINSKDDFAKLPNGAIYVFKIDNFREVKPTNEVLGFNPLGEIKFPH